MRKELFTDISHCETCNHDGKTVSIRYGDCFSRSIHICKPCYDYRAKNFKLAMFHLCILIAWVPLVFMVSEDLIIYVLGTSEYLFGFQWGIGATGALINIWGFISRMREAGRIK